MDAAEEVKSKLDVADIVGEYLQLKPAGAGSFRALCPFHQEKTPSFYINRPRQSWHCFGCDKGGDLISFVMEMEGLEFRDALEHLAIKAGVELPSYDVKTSGEKKRLNEVNDLAARYFRAALLTLPEAEHAREYATSRQIDDLTGDIFRIGWAPSSWSALTDALKGKGVTDDELVKAGLSIKNERGSVYDRFRDRLMFTIQDVHGNVVGFTGRLLDPNAKEAKYVNTPETAIYKKSAVLYGLDKAKGEIKRQNLAVICEGNMDVVSSHRAGVTNVVCSSGTALTVEQLRLIQRFTKNLTIAFDADAAGIAATLRGLDIARAQDFTIKIITLPTEVGKDPDDAVRKDVALWKDAIAHASDIMDWIFRTAFKGRNLSDPNEKKKIAADVLPELRRIADPVVRDHWLKKLAEGLGVGDDALREALKRANASSGPAPYVRPSTPNPEAKAPVPVNTRERDLAERIVCIALLKPDLVKEVPAGTVLLLPDDLSTLYTTLEQAYNPAEPNESARPAKLSDITDGLDETAQRLIDYLTIRADREYEQQTSKGLIEELRNTHDQLLQLQRSKVRARLEEDMRAAELAGDHARITELEDQFRELNKP